MDIMVSVVIVTWNRRDDVLEAITSIQKQAYANVEIVVVDNASTDGTAEIIQQEYPSVKLIALDHNTGACRGRAIGMEAASGAIIFTLDSDASLHHDTLTHIVAKFQQDPALGIITCKIVNAYTNEIDAWIFTEKDKQDQDTEFLSYSFCSAGCAIRKTVLEVVGSFWDKLFIYCEEDDLSLRVWDAGYKIVYWPTALVYHRESPQRRVTHSQRQYFDLRNSLYIYLVRYPWWMAARFVPLQIAISLIKGLRRGHLPQMLRALRDVLRELPALMRERQPIQNTTAQHYLMLQRQHGPLRWDLVSWLKHKV